MQEQAQALKLVGRKGRLGMISGKLVPLHQSYNFYFAETFTE